MKQLALIVALSLLANPTVEGAFYDGNDVYKYFQECDLKNNCNFINGWVAGVFESYQPEHQGAKVCNPDGISLNQLRDVIYLWFKNNPGRWTEDAYLLAQAAVNETWPCPEE